MSLKTYQNQEDSGMSLMAFSMSSGDSACVSWMRCSDCVS